MLDVHDYNETYMREALRLAEEAVDHGEIPVASVLVGDFGPIASSQTMVRRHGSIAAHGELFAILEAGGKVWSSGRLAIYTNLEPCLMCLGACAQAAIGTVFFGMRAKPDGAAFAAPEISTVLDLIPSVSGGHLEQESVQLMYRFLEVHPDSPSVPYVRKMLAFYEQ